ncbi:MAG TPA: EboA domain-containing protein [Vicinamibacterales bacterium]|jgi:hypothetical protein|nr:EboA domain-containing protein [Vicinamibacterales bacterium]
MTIRSLYEFLRAALRSRLDAGAMAWLDDAVTQAAGGTTEQLLAQYTKARRLGRDRLDLRAAELREVRRLQADLQFDQWTREDAGRATLLLARALAPGDHARFQAAVIECYERGDSSEQQSWLRSTALLPEPEWLLPVVIDACRTNILPLFEAVACENPYPTRHFPERNFNQMVLKALFNNVALARIVGLPARRNPDLTRMAADYASERRAAGRTVPSDIGLAMTETP